MPRLDFERFDLMLVVDSKEVRLSLADRTPEMISLEPKASLGYRIVTSETAYEWRSRQLIAAPESTIVRRVAIDIREPPLQANPWEEWLGRPLDKTPVVRVTHVRARAANVPFTLPLRLLEINPSDQGSILRAVRWVFSSSPIEKYAAAILVEERLSSEWDQLTRPEGWPSVDVIHLAQLPADLDENMLSGDAEQPGTVGWLVERLVRWQTRLLILHSKTAAEMSTLRRFAAAIAARGGPAVLVEHLAGSAIQRFYDRFYEQLIHDFPIDLCWREALQQAGANQFETSLFAGAGREEALRISNVASTLYDIARLDREHPRRNLMVRTFTRGLRGPLRDVAHLLVDNGLASLHHQWEKISFDLHESDGMLPMAEILKTMRVRAREVSLQDVMPQSRRKDSPRFVNSSFWVESHDRELVFVGQQEGSFEAGHIYHLGIQIGPRDVKVVTVNEAALIEEVFKWSREMTGVWIEIGVTGLDFEVLGDPVQRLWLPREGPSEIVYFAVSPRREGACRLRFSVYYEQNVIQSFLVAAVVGAVTDGKRCSLLSKALGYRTRVDAVYLPMVEYSLTQSIDHFVATEDQFAHRALSIISNDFNGQSVTTVKLAGDFTVNTSERLPGFVTTLHQQLNELSGTAPNTTYPFDQANNSGTRPSLERALRLLADRGREIYNDLFDSEVWGALTNRLKEPDQTIQVAQILREKVIPWAFVYSRIIDPFAGDRDAADGSLVNIPVCLAALPAADGTLPVKECGKSPQCVLNQTLPNPRKQENVICPLEFWGFKHIIEIPPKQVKGAKPGSSAGTEIEVDGDVRIVAGVNATFQSEGSHFTQIANAIGKLKNVHVGKIDKQYDSNAIKVSLKTPPVHLAYFFCHASGGLKNTRLIFQAPHPSNAEPILATDFGGLLGGAKKWEPPALVFLNGCRTANYNPEAVSPFLRSFVDQLGASGMIGTEITVWDVFAAEFGLLFLEHFLDCVPAGEALLRAKRVLLSKMNPLGLVYSLYASAGLHLKAQTHQP